MRPDFLAKTVADAITAAVVPLRQEIQNLKCQLAATELRAARDRAALVALQQRVREAESTYADVR